MPRYYWACDCCGLTFVTHHRKQPDECHSCHLPSVRRNWHPTDDSLPGMYPAGDAAADFLRDAKVTDG